MVKDFRVQNNDKWVPGKLVNIWKEETLFN